MATWADARHKGSPSPHQTQEPSWLHPADPAAGRPWSCLPVPRCGPALLCPWVVMGLGAVEQRVALVGEAGLRRSLRQGGVSGMAAAGPELCPAGRQLRPGEKWSTAAAGLGAKPLTAWVAGPAGRCECGVAEPTPTRNSRWPASGPCSPGSGPHLSLPASRLAEGAGSGLGQPRKRLQQCSGGLKGSSSAARVGAKAEEARRKSEGCEGCQHAVTSHLDTLHW
ncbi:uncharacterized protein LOC134810338 [Pan troglodytes]|uniref:uncharacterized protein LOC134810338 n=1 Tax=Pan troglodytes TaxID=9598 RepID=UPI0030140FDD